MSNRSRGGRKRAFAYLGDLSVLETLLDGDGAPVDVGLVLGMLHDGVEEHGLGGSRLLAGGAGFRHGDG